MHKIFLTALLGLTLSMGAAQAEDAAAETQQLSKIIWC